MRFEGRGIVVTGAGSGIGRVIARLFAQEGGRVAVNDQDRATVEATSAELGEQAIGVPGDVSRDEDVRRVVGEAARVFGAVDVLVNNAAICQADDVLKIEANDWDRELAVDLKGPFLFSREVLGGMVERRRGAIVNVSSVNGLAFFGNEAYSAAKAGMLSLTRSMAVRYGRYGVRVNAVVPGTIRTPAWDERAQRDPGVFERVTKWYPLGRVGEPEDVAKAVLFLASDDASWITGSMLTVDGGLMAGNAVMTREVLAVSEEAF